MQGISYANVGDYELPLITLSESPEDNLPPLGRYGRLRQAYLKEHRSILYNQMLMTETLFPHLREIDKSAEARFDVVIDPEVAHEIILAELVYV
jgi:hypothetical protein